MQELWILIADPQKLNQRLDEILLGKERIRVGQGTSGLGGVRQGTAGLG